MISTSIEDFLIIAFERQLKNDQEFIEVYEPQKDKVLSYCSKQIWNIPKIEVLIGSYKEKELFRAVFLENKIEFLELTEYASKLKVQLEKNITTRCVHFEDLLDYID